MKNKLKQSNKPRRPRTGEERPMDLEWKISTISESFCEMFLVHAGIYVAYKICGHPTKGPLYGKRPIDSEAHTYVGDIEKAKEFVYRKFTSNTWKLFD